MQEVQLNTGSALPVVGFGTWEISGDREAELAVSSAIACGYRHIDTAKIYGNERGVGIAIQKSDIPRSEIFVTTKLWNDDHGYDSAMSALDTSLDKLNLEYVDLYLIHWPATKRRHDAWRALEEQQQLGKAKNIGVSNFTIDHLEQLRAHSNTMPSVNQVEFHPFIYEQQKPLLDYCREAGVIIEAYSPLSRLKGVSGGEIHRIAESHHKTPQQIVLRWCLQHNTVPLPRSTNAEHMKQNIEIFDFNLSDEDMEALNSISDGERVTWDPAGMGS
ncbi:MAG TPA: aldo/keto reductase [Candidatus Saccharimonadales bacterium]|nr:aldo/keto reductase [Candidatus Saccharimonadales bacterium]